MGSLHSMRKTLNKSIGVGIQFNAPNVHARGLCIQTFHAALKLSYTHVSRQTDRKITPLETFRSNAMPSRFLLTPAFS